LFKASRVSTLSIPHPSVAVLPKRRAGEFVAGIIEMTDTPNSAPKDTDGALRDEPGTVAGGASAGTEATWLQVIRDAPVTSSSTPAAGAILGQYRFEEILGEGGMGAVWKATHLKLGKVVAIKLPPANLLNKPMVVTRFEREMKAVGMLSHPNLVQAFDAGEIGGTHYLAMEYVDGIDLSRLVRRSGPLPALDAIRYI
jgi:serine/threonine protein kinase